MPARVLFPSYGGFGGVFRTNIDECKLAVACEPNLESEQFYACFIAETVFKTRVLE